jgi:hypothetical protein
MKKVWVQYDDSDIHCIWKTGTTCLENGCTDTELWVLPSFYSESGTPICEDCGADLEYVRTEVRTKIKD